MEIAESLAIIGFQPFQLNLLEALPGEGFKDF